MRDYVVTEDDQASEQEQWLRDLMIKKARMSYHTIPPTGNCLNCDARLADGYRWCDADCRDDWEKRK